MQIRFCESSTVTKAETGALCSILSVVTMYCGRAQQIAVRIGTKDVIKTMQYHTVFTAVVAPPKQASMASAQAACRISRRLGSSRLIMSKLMK